MHNNQLGPRTTSFIGDPFPQDKQDLLVKTKVVCTIGPKTASEDMIGKLVESGMSVARLNFSHGTHEYHGGVITNIRSYCEKAQKIVAIMLDTKGPEIRTGKLEGGASEVAVEQGQMFTFLTDMNVLGNKSQIATTYKNLPKSVKMGDRILVCDGLVQFTVLHCSEDSVLTKCDNAGVVGVNKGVNLPGSKVDLPAVTEKDVDDIKFGVQQNVDIIACSFIRKAEDVEFIRNLPGVKENKITIISKIESQEGLDNFDAILAVSDGIMVARGDLGVEVPIERVCSIQKMIIAKCNVVGKPVITATQMLESMIVNPRPTRAEATDVANAVFDGSDCVMLSGETASGAWPCEAVRTMVNICREAERDINYRVLYRKQRADVLPPVDISESVASSAVKTAWDIKAKLIIVLTESGNTSRLVSKYRPHCILLCVTADARVARRCLINRACYPYLTHSQPLGAEASILRCISNAKKMRLCGVGDLVVVTSGSIEGVSGSTNLMRVMTIA